jgi:Xaa-Pro aminopeptidase
VNDSRLEGARSAMAERGIGLLAVSPSDDLRYLLGFAPVADERASMLLLGPRDATFLVPALNAEQARAAAPGLALAVWEDADGPEQALRSALTPFSLDDGTTVGVDGTMRADTLLLLQRVVSGARYVPADVVLGELRIRKDAGELRALRASARTADAAVVAAFEACSAGISELEIAEAAAAAFRREGCEEVAFTLVASGPHGAFPHHRSGARRLAEGDAVVIDLGGRLDGYCSDITRVVHVGEPTERYRRLHAVVDEAVRAGIAAVAPGAACGDVDRAARAVIEDEGLGSSFVHRTGHGLGLSIHEPPWVMAGDRTQLAAGMVFSVEPGVYFPGELGLRLEDIVRVTETGCEILSALPRDVYVARRR